MMPGMNPKMLKRAMKQMGVKQQEIEASQVIIKTEGKDLIINNPSVQKVKMMGQETIQIAGEIEEQVISEELEINEDDIKTVMEQAGASQEQARSSIEKHSGDLAAAILELSEHKE
jgi:nascent polypeptide-associated complex subunit alpha